jgi:hypothetical protein
LTPQAEVEPWLFASPFSVTLRILMVPQLLRLIG